MYFSQLIVSSSGEGCTGEKCHQQPETECRILPVSYRDVDLAKRGEQYLIVTRVKFTSFLSAHTHQHSRVSKPFQHAKRRQKIIHWRPQTILNSRHLSGGLLIFLIFWGCVWFHFHHAKRSEFLLNTAVGLHKTAWPVLPSWFILWAWKTRWWTRRWKSHKHAAFFQIKYDF